MGSVILRYGGTLLYAILPIFVWRFHSNPPRSLIRTPSCSSMHLKLSATQITSKNAKISTLDLYNFFLAGYFTTTFWETFNIYIMIIYPKFAPILRSQKKVDFSCSGSTSTTYQLSAHTYIQHHTSWILGSLFFGYRFRFNYQLLLL